MEKKISELYPSLINKKNTDRRIIYEYNEYIASKIWITIVETLIKNNDPSIASVLMTKEQKTASKELLFYAFADKRCTLNLYQPIGLYGRTGAGKTMIMEALSEFFKIDGISMIKNDKIECMNFNVFHVREIASEFKKNGMNALERYKRLKNICLDDIGTEPLISNDFGTKLNIVEDIIEERSFKGLATHWTTNLDETDILDRYDSRIHSRMFGKTNTIRLDEKDFRIKR